jgi:hypothetical protein
MPNRAGKTATKERRQAPAPVTETKEETPTVTTATTTELPDFASLVEDTEEGYKPERKPAGRKRTPSQFEPLLPRQKDKGWKRIPHDGNVKFTDEKDDAGNTTRKMDADSFKASNAYVILRELRKAQHFLSLGMDVNVTDTHVEYNVRDLQKRERKAAEAAKAAEEAGANDEDSDSESSGE